MLNYIWLALVMLAVAIGGWNDKLKDVTDGAFDGAKTAVTIALGLIGIMAMWASSTRSGSSHIGQKFVAAECRNQHAESVRYPEHYARFN